MPLRNSARGDWGLTAKKLGCSALAVMLAACGLIRGQEPPGLAGFASLKQDSAHRVSSDNPNPSSNDDSKRILPGETLVMADLTGPGTLGEIGPGAKDAIPALEEAIQAHRLGSGMREIIRKIEDKPSPTLF